MKKIAVVVDSNSGVNKKHAEELGIYVVPMLFMIDGKEYEEDVTITNEQFFEYQMSGSDITSSQPSPGNLLELWESLLEEHDEVVHIPMSSALSGAYATAMALSQEFENRVFVVDNKRVSVTQKQSAIDARKMAEQGMTGAEIKEHLEKTALDSSIYITVDTLKFLKKGGRITPTAAAVGELISVKPVLQIQGEKIDAYAKTRGRNKSKQAVVKAIQKDMEERFAGVINTKGITLHAAYAGIEEEALEWKAELEQIFPGYTIDMDELPLNISTHVGKGAMGMAITVNI